jgi:hypothetical protein
MARFCSNCGAALNDGARFCHVCGTAVGAAGAGAHALPSKLFWAPIVVSLVAVAGLVAIQFGSLDSAPSGEDQIIAPRAPDISQMSPQEQANRLFDRVMRLTEEGKKDSALLFAPMAMGAIEALGPLNAHRRYDIGVIALASDDLAMATAQADTILKARPTHLLGLVIAARTAIARGDSTAAAKYWQRLIAAEPAERTSALPEYAEHASDVAAGLDRANRR